MEKNPGIDFPLLEKVDERIASVAEYASKMERNTNKGGRCSPRDLTHQRTGRGGWGGCSPPSRGKNSIIRAKLMYRSGKDTAKIFYYLIS